MLAKYWRYQGYWVGDDTLTYADGARVNVRSSPWELVSGTLTYGTTITDDMGFTTGTWATTVVKEGDVNDNTSNLYYGINGFLEVIADINPSTGDFYLYLEESDDNSNWPSDSAAFQITKHCRLVAVLNIITDAEDEGSSVNFEF